MDLKVFIKTTNNCSVLIKDKSEYKDDISDKNFPWLDCITVDVIKTNYSTGATVDAIVTEHTSENLDRKNREPIVYSPSSDAWFTIDHIVLPTKVTVNKWISEERSKLSAFYLIYCIDEEGTPWKYDKARNLFESISWKDVLEVNPDAEVEGKKNTISKYTQEFVSVCNLKNCYINLCLLIFQSRMLNGSCSGRSRICKENNKSQEDLWYRRDLVWSALNVIKYMVEDKEFAAAELLIEQILNSCNGVCKGIVLPGKDCGCNS